MRPSFDSGSLRLALVLAVEVLAVTWASVGLRSASVRRRLFDDLGAYAVICGSAGEGSRSRFVRERGWEEWSRTLGQRARWFGDRVTRRSQREARSVRHQLPALCEAMARDLRGGVSISAALWSSAAVCTGPLADDIGRVRRSVSSGTGLVDGLNAWLAWRPLPELAAFVAAARVGLEVGGELAPAFDACGAALRDRLEVDDEVKALTSQSRASGVLLTALPWVAAGGLAALNPASGRFLVSTTAGGLCLVLGVFLDVAGWAWMTRLVGGSR